MISGEGGTQVGQRAVGNVLLELLAIEVLGLLVAETHVEGGLTNLGADLLEVGSLLHEASEGGDTSTKTSHDDRSLGILRDLHGAGADGNTDLSGTLREVNGVQVGGAETVLEDAGGSLPVHFNDAEVELLGLVVGGGGDGVETGLDDRDHLEEMGDVDLDGLEGLQGVEVGGGLLVELFELLLALAGDHEFELGLLLLGGGEVGHLAEELLGDTTVDVEDLAEDLAGGGGLRELLHQAGLGGADGEDGLLLHSSELAHLLDGGGAVLGVDGERVTGLVVDAGVAEVELEVHDVSVVVLGSQALLLDEGNQLKVVDGDSSSGDGHGVLLVLLDLEGGGGDAGLDGLGDVHALKVGGLPLLVGGVVAVAVLVVAEADGADALSAELLESLVEELGGEAELVVVAVAEAEDGELDVLEEVGGEGLVLDGLPEGLGVGGEVALAGGGADDDDVALGGEVGGGDVVELHDLNAALSLLALGHEALSDALGVAGGGAVEDGHEGTLSGVDGGLELVEGKGLADEVDASGLEVLLEVGVELLSKLGLGAVQLEETALVGEEDLEVVGELLLVVELEGDLALELEERVVSVERPVAGLDGELDLLVGGSHGGNDVLHQAGGVAEDDGGTGVGLGLGEGAEGLAHIGVEGDGGDVDVLVGHGHHAHLLLVGSLTSGGELDLGGERGGLGLLATGVGVHLGIEDDDVDILAGREDVVDATVTDIVGPTITTDDPLGDLGEQVLLGDDGLEGLGGVGGVHDGELGVDGLGDLLAGLGVGEVDEPVAEEVHELGLEGVLLLLEELLDVGLEGVTSLGGGDGHAEAVLGVILEEGVGPGGTLALLVHGVGVEGSGTTPNGGAAGGVGDDHSLTEQLGQHLDVGGLTAAIAGAGELEERNVEHGVLEGVAGDEVALLLDAGGVLPVLGLDLLLGEHLLHDDGLVTAGLDAELAAGTVEGRDLDSEVVVGDDAGAHGLDGLEGLGGALELLVADEEGTDGGVGADHGALVALGTVVLVPGGDGVGEASLLVSGGTGGHLTTGGEDGDGELVALVSEHGHLDLVDKVDDALQRLDGLDGEIGPGLGVVDGDQGGEGLVDGGPVLLDDGLTLLHVGLLNGLLEVADTLLDGHAAGDLEVDGGHGGVDVLAEGELLGETSSVADVELGVLLGDGALDLVGEEGLEVLELGVLGVQEEDTVVLEGSEDVVLVHVGVLGAGDVVGVLDEVGGGDGLLAVTEVVDGVAVGLLGLVLGVALDVHVGVVTEDLHEGLGDGDGTIGAEAPHDGLPGALRDGVVLDADGEGAVGDIIDNADGEGVDGVLGAEVLEDGDGHAGGEVLAAETVAAADDGDVGQLGALDGGGDIEVEGLTGGGGILAAIEDGDALDGLGQDLQEVLSGPGAVEAAADDTDLGAVLVQVGDGLHDDLAAGSHTDDDVLGVLGSKVLEESVALTEGGGELLEDLVDDVGDLLVEVVGGFDGLEVDIGGLGGTSEGGVVGVEGALSVLGDGVPGDELLHGLLGNHADVDGLVGGTEAIEEVAEGDLGAQGGDVGDEGHIVGLLDGLGGEEGEAGGAGSHDIGVVTVDVEGLAGDGTGSDVEDAGEELTGDLVHVGDHEEEALGGGEGGAEATGGEGAVDGTGGTGLGLHLDDGTRDGGGGGKRTRPGRRDSSCPWRRRYRRCWPWGWRG